MGEGAKRRIVGTAVILVLLVIFLPMLVEEDAPGPVPDDELQIPAEPAFERDYEQAIIPGPDEPAVPPELPSIPQELPPPAFFEAPALAEPEREPESEPIPEPEIVPAPEPELEPTPTPVVVETAPDRPEPPPEPQPAPTGGPAWIVQVASLSDPQGAKKLQGELRAKGFPAFIETAEVGQKRFHRVRVGPELDRKRIEAVAASLKDKTGYEGQIQRYR